jgi:hypothetical protein
LLLARLPQLAHLLLKRRDFLLHRP